MEERISMHSHRPHATSQPSLFFFSLTLECVTQVSLAMERPGSSDSKAPCSRMVGSGKEAPPIPQKHVHL